MCGNANARTLGINTLLNAFRQSSALLFQLVTFPYASRVLGSEAYGGYSFSLSVVGYFLLLSGFGISNYAVREGGRIRDDREKMSALASDLLSVNLVTMAASYVLLGAISILVPRFRSCIFLIAIQSGSMLLSAIGMDYVNVIYEDYLYITIRYIALQFIAGIAIFLFVRGPEDVVAYCVIMLVGTYGGNLVNLAYVRHYVTVRPRIKRSLAAYFKPLSILFVNSLAATIYVNCDITMLGFFHSDRIVGIYGFTSRVYGMLKMFINSVMTVATPRLSYLRGTDEAAYWALIKKILGFLVMLLLPVATGAAIFSRPIIQIIGGGEYLPGSGSFRILMAALIFALLAFVFSNGILIINRMESRCLVSTSISAAINIALNFVLIPRCGMVGAAVTTVIAEFTNLAIQSYFCRGMLRISDLMGKRELLASVAGCCLVGAICMAIERVVASSSAWVCIAKIFAGVLLSAVAYLLTLWIFLFRRR